MNEQNLAKHDNKEPQIKDYSELLGSKWMPLLAKLDKVGLGMGVDGRSRNTAITTSIRIYGKGVFGTRTTADGKLVVIRLKEGGPLKTNGGQE